MSSDPSAAFGWSGFRGHGPYASARVARVNPDGALFGALAEVGDMRNACAPDALQVREGARLHHADRVVRGFEFLILEATLAPTRVSEAGHRGTNVHAHVLSRGSARGSPVGRQCIEDALQSLNLVFRWRWKAGLAEEPRKVLHREGRSAA